MPNDGYIGLAPDGPGKQVEMEAVTGADGVARVRQRADLSGEALACLKKIEDRSRLQLACLRAILARLDGTAEEEDYL